MRERLGIDTGGTFTDFVRVTPSGIVTHKLPSTPENPARAILQGIAELTGHAGVTIVHGSTVATNAVLERKGARVALVTTAGFQDVLQIGRQTRASLYDVFVEARRPIVERSLIFGITERLDAAGRVLVPIDASDLDALVFRVADSGAEIVAVCLLHAYANPEHERLVASALGRRGLRVCVSHDVLPEYREYERSSTTVLNAYVTPVVDVYLGHLEETLGAAALLMMQSNGGIISAAAARRQPIRTVLSGPAAGVVGASAVAARAGFARTIAFDMGGTSTDVSLIDGDVSLTTESHVGDFPMRLPVLAIHTVGAGGGSIVRVDAGQALRVGPESAGADPGPACYGRGTEFTVTDANLLLGRLDPDRFLDGRMRLDIDQARRAASPIARRLGVDLERLAAGVIRVANANMQRAIRHVSVERGEDPRRFALVAFGGAGGMHAAELARELGIASVLVPRHAGVLSALGMLYADVTRDYSVTVLRRSDEVDARGLERRLSDLVDAAAADLAREGFNRRACRFDRLIDVRYAGQSYEITLPWSRHYRRDFDRRHAHTYGHANPSRATEVVALRVRAVGKTGKPALARHAVRRRRPSPAAVRHAWFDQRRVRAACYAWADLAGGDSAHGPAIITSGTATVVVPPRTAFRVDAWGNILLRTGQ